MDIQMIFCRKFELLAYPSPVCIILPWGKDSELIDRNTVQPGKDLCRYNVQVVDG